MKKLIRKAVRSIGFSIHRNAFTPLGTDPFLDISNHFNWLGVKQFFDVGANTGQTISRIKQVYPKAIINAFEPINETFSELKVNYGGKSGVHLEAFGFGAAEEERIIGLSENSLWNSMKNLANEETKKAEKVTLKTIDRYLKEKRIPKIDFLKIDVESFEIEVLKGAHYSLENKFIDFVFCEVGINRNDTHHTPFPDVLEFLTPFGFKFISFYDHALVNTDAHFANALFFNSHNLTFR